MNIKRLRPGNIIKISPRENEEGIVSIDEIHKDTIIAEMLVPRQGYHFRIRFYEVLSIPLTEAWLTKCGFAKDENNPAVWNDVTLSQKFCFEAEGKKQFCNADGSLIGTFPVEFLHDFQNGYLFLTGKEIELSI